MRPDSGDDVISNGGMTDNSSSGGMTSGNNSVGAERSCIDKMPLAMAYIPMQEWQNIYENGKAIMRGTIFEELDLPFKGAGRR